MKETTDTHERLFHLLTRYISRLMARTIIDRALARSGLSADRLSPETLMPVVEQARIGLGMFCEPDQLSALMLDLASFCDISTRERESTNAGFRATLSPPTPAPARSVEAQPKSDRPGRSRASAVAWNPPDNEGSRPRAGHRL